MIQGLLKQLLTPKKVGEFLAAVVGHIKEMEARDGCKYELRGLTVTGEDFRIDIYKRRITDTHGTPPEHVRSYNKSTAHELLNEYFKKL